MTEANIPAGPSKQVEIQDRLHALFGGKQAFDAYMGARFREFQGKWEHDSTAIGKVLHAHLVVEDYLTELIELSYPQIPDLRKLGLRFEQKISMIPKNEILLQAMESGLRALGSIRNKLSHRREVQITKDDIQAIMNVTFYSSGSLASNRGVNLKDPVAVVLDFAQWAASLLHNACDPHVEKWNAAFDMTVPVQTFRKAQSEGLPGVSTKPRILPG